MLRDERVQMWQKRIDAYRSSDAPSIKAWCIQNQVSVQSMYNWMKRLESEPTRPMTEWVAIDPSHSMEGTATLSVLVGENQMVGRAIPTKPTKEIRGFKRKDKSGSN